MWYKAEQQQVWDMKTERQHTIELWDMVQSSSILSNCGIRNRAAAYYQIVWYWTEHQHTVEFPVWSRAVAYCRILWYWALQQHTVELCDIKLSSSILSKCVILNTLAAYCQILWYVAEQQQTVDMCDIKHISNILSICVIWTCTVSYCQMCDM